MIHILTHITTEAEVARLPGLQVALHRCFPDSKLHIFNQSGYEIADSIVQENTKSCGFGWTMRFLRHAMAVMQPGDLFVKIDPDVELHSNPLVSIAIPEGACFGQIKLVRELPVFLGGFQGFTLGAVETLVKYGAACENEAGKQDPILYRLGASLGMDFISLPWIDLWAERENYDPNLKVISWRRNVS